MISLIALKRLCVNPFDLKLQCLFFSAVCKSPIKSKPKAMSFYYVNFYRQRLLDYPDTGTQLTSSSLCAQHTKRYVIELMCP